MSNQVCAYDVENWKKKTGTNDIYSLFVTGYSEVFVVLTIEVLASLCHVRARVESVFQGVSEDIMQLYVKLYIAIQTKTKLSA